MNTKTTTTVEVNPKYVFFSAYDYEFQVTDKDDNTIVIRGLNRSQAAETCAQTLNGLLKQDAGMQMISRYDLESLQKTLNGLLPTCETAEA